MHYGGEHIEEAELEKPGSREIIKQSSVHFFIVSSQGSTPWVGTTYIRVFPS